MKTVNQKILCIILISIMLLCSLALSACSSDTERETEIISAEISNNKKSIVIKATLSDEYLAASSGKRIYLLAIDSIISDSLDSFTIADDIKAKGSMKFKLSLTDTPFTYLSCAFVLAELVSGEGENGVYKAISEPIYLQNTAELSSSARRPIGVPGIKGISTNDVYEAELSGADHILFEASIDKLLLAQYETGAINYLYENRSYYFDKSEVEKLDDQISDATALGLRVYLRTTLHYPEKNADGTFAKAPINELYCPGATYGSQGYLPNMKNSSAAGYVKAFYSFLASRYNVSDALVLDYIIGDSVNDFTKNCNSGNYSREQFEKGYLSWVRSAYNIISSNCKNAQVYVSSTNKWRTEDRDKIGARVFLGNFASLADASNDFPWQIAMNMGQGEDLSSVLAGNSADFSTICTGNYQELFEFTNQESMLYDSKARSVIIDGFSLSNTASEKNRAAYYAYTFYKAAEAGFGAIIYSATEPDCSLYNSYGTRSDLYYVFLMCGSDKTSQIRNYTGKIPDPKMPDFNDFTSRYLTYQQESVKEIGTTTLRNRNELPVRLTAFLPCGSAENADFGTTKIQGKDQLSLSFTGEVGQKISAVTSFDVPAANIIESGYLGVTLSSPNTSKVALIISGKTTKDAKNATYIGEAEITSLPQTYYFNISPFTKNAVSSDSLDITICVITDKNASSYAPMVCISDPALYGTSGSGTKTITTVIVIIISTLAICGLLFLLTRRRSKMIRHA